MRIKALLVLLIFHHVALGQAAARKADAGNQQPDISIRKQLIVGDLENQMKDSPLAAVRVFARYKLAAWLWRGGKDETGQAERLTVKALDELYENRAEIPTIYFGSLSSSMFALLEANAKGAAQQLKAKYRLDSEDELKNAYSSLDAKNGEKAAADTLQKSLADKTELSPMTLWLMQELQERRSPELLRIMDEIVSLEESGRSNFSAETFFFTVDYFRGAQVSNELRLRFYNVVCNKAKSTILNPDSDARAAYDLLNAVLPDISKNAPALLPEASTLQYACMSRVPPSAVEAAESYKKIDASSDRLSALISEAEASRDKGLRANLLTRASQLALQQGNFRLAVELIDKVKANTDVEKDGRFTLWHDQFLSDVSEHALKEGDTEAATYATERVINKLTLANVLRVTALHYYEKRDLVAAGVAFDKALKLVLNADNNVPKIYLLIRLIATAQKIDRSRISEIAGQTAKAINALPCLAVGDKPETENYRNYVSSVMAINERLTPVFAQLVEKDRSEAVAFAASIKKKEVTLMLNYTFLVDSLRPELAKGN